MNDQQIEQEIQAKGKTAPRVAPQHIESVIASEHYFTAAEGVIGNVDAEGDMPESLDLLTFCVLVLKNGFTVIGESACASKENFNKEIGQKIALEKAKEKIWALEGYLLKEQLATAEALI